MQLMFIWLLLGIALLYLAGCALLASFQRSLIYYPQPAISDSADATQLLPVADAQVRVTVRSPEAVRAIIYFGGNAENATLSLPELAQAFPDDAIYLMHYRGYGGSTGRPSEAVLQADALVLFDLVHEKHPKTIVIGRSLGSGIAIRVAARRPVLALILVTPYNSLLKLAQQQFPFLPVSWLLLDRYESWRYASEVRAPTLLIMAEHDEVIPRTSTEELFPHFAQGVARLTIVRGASHNTVTQDPAYAGLLKSADLPQP